MDALGDACGKKEPEVRKWVAQESGLSRPHKARFWANACNQIRPGPPMSAPPHQKERAAPVLVQLRGRILALSDFGPCFPTRLFDLVNRDRKERVLSYTTDDVISYTCVVRGRGQKQGNGLENEGKGKASRVKQASFTDSVALPSLCL